MGELKNLRWPVVAITLALTVALLYGANWALRAGTQDSPLATFLAAQPAVASHQLDRAAGKGQVRVQLRPVPDLAETYTGLARAIDRIAGPGRLELVVQDRRTPELAEAYYRINPLLQEALATGRYGDLVERVEARSAALGLERARVSIDAGRVYLQLHQGPDYLYDVLPRPDVPPAGAAGTRAQTGGWK